MKKVLRVLIIVALLAGAYYYYQHYKLRTSGPQRLHVDTGSITYCIGCGKVLSREVRTIEVPAVDARRYRVVKKEAVCEACSQQGIKQ